MNKIVSVLIVVLVSGLVSCAPILEGYSKNGSRDKLAIRYSPVDNGVKFECLDSHSGVCYFTVMNYGCRSKKLNIIFNEKTCGESLESFSLAVGEVQIRNELPIEGEVCLSENHFPRYPKCLSDMKSTSYQSENRMGSVTMVYPNYSK